MFNIELVDFTIVIPTKDRPFYVERILTYYLSMNFLGNILLIDSSNKENSNYIREYVDNIGKKNYVYTFSDGLPVQVVKENLDLIKTKYVSFLGDDDYIIPNSVLKSISFLEKNLDISGCRGEGFIVTDPKISSEYIKMYGCTQRLEGSSGDRLYKFFSNYTPPLFHVCRSNIFKKAFSQAPSMDEINKGYDRLIGDEIIVTSLMLVYGKFASIPGLHLVRTNNIERNELRNSWYYDNSDTYKEGRAMAINDFTNKVATAISEQDSISFDEAEKIALKVQAFPVFSKKYNSELKIKFKKLLKPFLTFIGLFGLLISLREFSSIFKRKVIMYVTADHNKRLGLKDVLEPDNYYHKDFVPIYSSLIVYNSQDK